MFINKVMLGDKMSLNYKKLAILVGVLAVFTSSIVVYANLGNSQNLDGLQVEFDQEKYSVSDEVQFNVTNNENEPIEFKNGAPWTIKMKKDGKWKAVEDHMATMQVWELEPDESRGWTWNPENSLDWYKDLEDKSGNYAVFIKGQKAEFTIEG